MKKLHDKYNRKHLLYNKWAGIKQRCYNPKNQDYDTYGAVGITMSDEWINDSLAFMIWCDNNGWQPGLQIDRIDAKMGYIPSNIRFLSASEHSSIGDKKPKRLPKSVKRKTNYPIGVVFRKNRNKYFAYINYCGKQLSLGYHKELDSAIHARKQAEHKFYPLDTIS